jgi:metal transporter CNNM
MKFLNESEMGASKLQEEPVEDEGNFYVNLGVVLFCTCFAGLMSGLTIGLASIDRLTLEVDSMGNPAKQKLTKRIFPVIDQHHWMLVTLLLCNAGAMETLPLFLDKMVSPALAIILSVTLVLIFGEIIPQALCTGSNQLCIAYYLCPVV